jgi:peptide/nickel transport system permease protein
MNWVRQDKLGLIGIIILALAAVVGPWLTGMSATDFTLTESLKGPIGSHLFGFDEDGRDLLTLVLMGARISLFISIVTILITATVGTIIGSIAAYYGGRIDEFFIFVTDVLLAFPSILLVIALAAFQTQTSVLQVIVILCVVGWVSFARLVRGQVLALKERDFISAARVVGCRFPRLLIRYFVPNLAGPLLVQASFGMAGVIIAESTLSFLGLGVPPHVPSWGRLLDQGVQYLLVAPHLSIFPGIAIVLTIVVFHLIGDGLRDKLDVRGID